MLSSVAVNTHHKIVVNSIKITMVFYDKILVIICRTVDQFCRMTWCSKELLAAALCLPGTVGWSGMVESHSSNLVLNISGDPVLMSLSSLGIKLKSWAPFTCSDDSLAFLTAAGAWLQRGARLIIRRPLLTCWWKVALYPCTNPCATFQRKIIWYLSLLLSWE